PVALLELPVTPAPVRIPVPRLAVELRGQPVGQRMEPGRQHCGRVRRREESGCLIAAVGVDRRTERALGIERRGDVRIDLQCQWSGQNEWGEQARYDPPPCSISTTVIPS